MNTDSPEAQEVRKLFESRIAPITSGAVVIRGIVREPGIRTIVTVASTDSATDAVGSCVGMRGAIIKGIVTELQGERIDVVLWNDSAKKFLSNLFAPMRFLTVSFDEATHYATAVLHADSELAPSKTIALRSLFFRELTGWVLRLETQK